LGVKLTFERSAEVRKDLLELREFLWRKKTFQKYYYFAFSEPTQPLAIDKLKKGEERLVVCFEIYGRFLSISTVAMAIAMIMAIAATTMYVIRSAVVATFEIGVEVGVCVGVAAGFTTVTVVAALELP
jgi:hypothetical protein